MSYPTRCEIIDPVFTKYTGKKGIADLIDGNFSPVKVTLDDGTVLSPCSYLWKPID